jgi:hypothetical protein
VHFLHCPIAIPLDDTARPQPWHASFPNGAIVSAPLAAIRVGACSISLESDDEMPGGARGSKMNARNSTRTSPARRELQSPVAPSRNDAIFPSKPPAQA